jgi:hypothetical protein
VSVGPHVPGDVNNKGGKPLIRSSDLCDRVDKNKSHGMRLLRASIIGLVSCWNAFHPVYAAESVQFEGALQAQLTASEAVANNVPIFPPAPKLVQGYIQKPDGRGPFPAVIVLHGCAGLGSLFDPLLA